MSKCAAVGSCHLNARLFLRSMYICALFGASLLLLYLYHPLLTGTIFSSIAIVLNAMLLIVGIAFLIAAMLSPVLGLTRIPRNAVLFLRHSRDIAYIALGLNLLACVILAFT